MLDTTALSTRPAHLELSPEQTAIARFIDSGTGNVLVVARAGTGKTFLIRMCLPLMRGPIAVCAFGSAIAKEVAAKVAADGNKADIGTFHSFGWRALRTAFPKAKLEGKGPGKAGVIKFDVIADQLEVAEHMRGFVRKAMDLAMQSGFGVFFPLNDPKRWLDLVAHYDLDSAFSEDNIGLKLHGRAKLIQIGCQLAAKALRIGVQMAHEIISFADMLYLPLVLDLKLPQFRWVLVDEAQDTNAVRREMAKRMLMPGGRMMWVGDDCQSIYGFTGADAASLDTIAAEFGCTRFPMTETRRCSHAVVALAKTLVPDFRAHPSNAAGNVLRMDEKTFLAQTLVAGDDALICRLTGPLVKAAYKLIAIGVPAHVEGKKIGDGLVDLVDRFPGANSVKDMLHRLNEYQENRTNKLISEKKDAQAAELTDAVEAIHAIASTLPDGAQVVTLRSDIKALFSDTPDGQRSATVTCMTAHRSKGLEFKRVFGYGVSTHFPSPWAKQEWQLQQERNLEYVLYTRAIDTYVDVDI